MVKKSREPHLAVPLCGITYRVKYALHAIPALCPARVVLRRFPLGRGPSLHQLRSRRIMSDFVRRLLWYYDLVRLPTLVHHRRTPFAVSRCGLAWLRRAERGLSRFSCRRFPGMLVVSDHVGLVSRSRYRCCRCCLPHIITASASQTNFSRLNTLPACAPVNASCVPCGTGTRMTRGRCGSLFLQRATLTFATSCRF